MSARDDLADLLDPRRKSRRSGGSVLLSAESVTERILAAGWRPPARKIETVEELDALPEGSIVRDSWGITLTKDYESWYRTLADDPDEVELPAIVLWEPGDGDE